MAYKKEEHDLEKQSFFISTSDWYWGFAQDLREALANAMVRPETLYTAAVEQLEQLFDDDINSPPHHVKAALREVAGIIADARTNKTWRVRLCVVPPGYKLDSVSPVDGAANFSWHGEGEQGPALPGVVYLNVSPIGIVTVDEEQYKREGITIQQTKH